MSDWIEPEDQKKAREKTAKERNRSILQWMGKTSVASYLKASKRKLERALLSTYEEFTRDGEEDNEGIIQLDSRRKDSGKPTKNT